MPHGTPSESKGVKKANPKAIGISINHIVVSVIFIGATVAPVLLIPCVKTWTELIGKVARASMNNQVVIWARKLGSPLNTVAISSVNNKYKVIATALKIAEYTSAQFKELLALLMFPAPKFCPATAAEARPKPLLVLLTIFSTLLDKANAATGASPKFETPTKRTN